MPRNKKKASTGPSKAQHPKPLAASAKAPAAKPQQEPGGKEGLVREIVVISGSGEHDSPSTTPAALPLDVSTAKASEAAEVAEAAEAVAEAADAAAAGGDISDDEGMLDEPQDGRRMSQAQEMAAAQLEQGGDLKAAVAMWDQAIVGAPDQHQLYLGRGYTLMQLRKEKEAITDFTIALELPDCLPEARFQSLLCRAFTKQQLGDLEGADTDLKAAFDAATGPEQRQRAMESRRGVVTQRVAAAKEREARKKDRPVHSYRGGTAVIEELDPQEGTTEHDALRAHEMAVVWQEVAAKVAVAARGDAARLARQLESERARVREENQARTERNAVRAARRRSASEAAQHSRLQQAAAAAPAAAMPAAAATAAAAVQQFEVVERTRIPIEVVEGGISPSSRSGSSMSESGRSSRSTNSRLAGYASGSESEEARQPLEPAVATEALPAEAEELEQSAAAAAQAAASEREEEAASIEAAAGAEPVAAAVALPSDAELAAAAALPSDVELEALKVEADRLLQAGQHEEAEAHYARYLALRPADLRVWSNRAENSSRAQHWQDALQSCNEALAVATPSHPLPRHKLFFRRGTAYQGAGRLQEALRDYEAAMAATEGQEGLQGMESVRHGIAKRQAKVLAEMEARGIEPVPSGPDTLGLQASAAAAAQLPSVPLVPEQAPPEDLGVGKDEEEGVPAGSRAGAGTSATAGPSTAAAESEGAEGPSAEEVEAAMVSQLASAEARERGNECFRRRKWEQALAHYTRAAELDPSSEQAWANKAAALLKLQLWDQAAAAADKALLLNAHSVKALFRRAHAFAGGRLWEQALVDMQNVVAAEPGDKRAELDLEDFKRRKQEDEAGVYQGSGF